MKLRSIQVARGVAAVAVVCCHFGPFPLGAAGVDLFFVISGFIIATVMPGKTWGRFLADRVWRIYPLYWLLSFPWVLMVLMAGVAEPSRMLTSITLWPYFGEFSPPYMTPGWTLMFEMLFYVGTALVIATRRGPLIVTAFAGLCLLNLFISHRLIGFLGNPLILEFLAGVVIAKLPRSTGAGLAALAVGIAAMLVVQPAPYYRAALALADTSAYLRAIGWGLPCALIVYGMLSLERFFGRAATPLVKLGDASYSIYLVHSSVYAVGIWHANGVFVSLAVGLVIHQFIERRIMTTWRPLPSRENDDPGASAPTQPLCRSGQGATAAAAASANIARPAMSAD